ncbi:8-oxoguanine glycosylase ogg1 [Orbilia brochopaga]|uniref:DNA-(apurinic or apyrimidinic site) lyase n=1 Tax=Orbilia brochopaga TaxID=3140254 RepID=A0AAV9UET8_9PEZI
MMKGHATAWAQLPVALNQLCLATVLRCGQSFRWKASGPGEWSCGFPDRIISLRQSDTHLHYRATYPATPPAKDDTEEILKDYFNLSVDLASLYEKWSAADPNFKKKAGEFRGVRMLRQDPWECLVGFICSSNNNISRISQMVDKLCATFGAPLGTITHTSTPSPPLTSTTPSSLNAPTSPTHTPVPYFSFPSIAALTPPTVESTLRSLGFGYRAKYLHQTAILLHSRPPNYLTTLRTDKTYREAHDALLEFSGVGPKVADCVCLMSLDKMGAVPVDTHVWQIATRDYKFRGGKNKSMTKAVYDAVGEHFRGLWGDEAGWAHSVLFTADLRAFSDRLESTKVKVKKEVKVEEEEEVKVEVKEEAEVKVEVKEEEVALETAVKRTTRKRAADGVVKEAVVKVEEKVERRVRRRRG